MFRRITLFTVVLCTTFFTSQAQGSWSLEKCITTAQQNSLLVKQAQYQISGAELTEKGNKFNRLPTLNGRISAGYQLGRTIDPTTNEFESQNIGFNSYSVDASIPLYTGGRIANSIKQSKIDLEAAQLDARATSNDISLQVAGAYLSILLAEEQLQAARKRLELSESQLAQTEKLIRAGTLPVNDRLDFEAQIALDQQTIIEAENLVTINYLNLKQLMVIDPGQDISIQRPDVVIPADANPEAFRLNEVFTSALGTQPQIRADELRIQSAEMGERIAKASTLPSVFLFGGLSTNYSSVAKDFTKANFDNASYVPDLDNTRLVLINEMEPAVAVTEFTYVGVEIPDQSFGDQINQNFGQNFGVSVNIPIYNNHSNKIAMERAKLNALTAQVSYEQNRQLLRTDVQRAITDARAAKESYQAAQQSVRAAQAAYENSQKRFDLGAINSLEFTTARNTLDRAQVDLIRAKYQYLFNLKIVDFYVGRQLTLD